MKFSHILSSALAFCLAEAYLVPPPGPAAPGASKKCSAWVESSYGLTCDIVMRRYGLTRAQFIEWNPTAGDNCNLLEGFCYCVQVNFQTQTPATQTKTWTPTTSSSTSTQAPISTPTPTQAGMVGNCNKFHLVVSGDNCYDIAAKYGVKLNDFYTWNPATGTSCSGLWLDYYVCVGVTTGGTPPTPTPTTLIPSTTTPPPGGVATPTPIQNGMVKNCDTFHLVVAGDNCYDIAAKSKIALNDFYTWNPDVGNTCANLWAGYYVCIGIL